MEKDLFERIKNLNIDLCEVTDAEDLNFEEILNERFEKNYQTEFESKDFKSRISPRMHLKNAKSVFVIGESYYYPEKNSEYKISNHARGMDYHIVMNKKVDSLINLLKEDYEFNFYKQVDTGSLLEKEFAKKSGLGFIGKNSLLINENYGSYIFLALLVTDLDFGKFEKRPEKDFCKNCNLCVKACPSGAILGDYSLNARICHSYLTQTKEYDKNLSGIEYAYGCDICQKVCPKNKNIKYSVEKDFEPKIYGFDKDFIEKLSNRAFKKEYRDFSFSWVSKNTILRNIKILDR